MTTVAIVLSVLTILKLLNLYVKYLNYKDSIPTLEKSKAIRAQEKKDHFDLAQRIIEVSKPVRIHSQKDLLYCKYRNDMEILIKRIRGYYYLTIKLNNISETYYSDSEISPIVSKLTPLVRVNPFS